MSTLQDKINSCNNLSDLFIYLKESIYENLSVSTLAYFDSVYRIEDNYQILCVKPFPLNKDEEDVKLFVYDFNVNTQYDKDEKLLIVFADRNFTNSLINEKFSNKKTFDNEPLHTTSYGIVIPLKEKVDSYSQDETLIGTWINGEKLYRKVLTFDGSLGKETYNELGKLCKNSELSQIVKIDYVVKINDRYYSNYYVHTEDGIDSVLRLQSDLDLDGDTTIVAYHWGNPINCKIIATIEYTK